MEKLYDKNSIESLDPREFTRLRPQVYCGPTEYSTQLFIELFSNAVDEFNLGHGKKITVIWDSKLGQGTVADEGQGFIPNEMREDGKSVLEAAYSVMNTSGKYREDGVYEGTSLGSFGIGSKLACWLSEVMFVVTMRDGVSETVSFKDGLFSGRKIGKAKAGEHGTVVAFKPDKQFFEHVEPDIGVLKHLFEQTTALCPGLEVSFTIDGNTETYKAKKGIEDLVDKVVGDKEIISNRLRFTKEEGKAKLNCCLTYTSNYSCTIVPYVNLGLTESGAHITTFKTVLTKAFNQFARVNKLLKEKDENLTGDDIQEGLYVVFNLQWPGIAYDAQVKSRVSSRDFVPFITKALNEALNDWFNRHAKDAKSIVEKALSARKAREAAKKAREAVRKATAKKTRAVLPGKLADCSSRKRDECEIFLVEGDSAGGTAKDARNRETQAVLPLRGKILNVFKADLAKALQNEEIKGMITAFGLELKDSKVVVDESKLRYGKIIVMADADVDGSHIRVLFYTFIWKFAPELITKGYIYAAVPPLYKIIQGKNSFYLQDDAALEAFRKSPKSKASYTLQRFKG